MADVGLTDEYAVDGAMIQIGPAQFVATIDFLSLQQTLSDMLREEGKAFLGACLAAGGDAEKDPALFGRMQRVRALLWAKELAARKIVARLRPRRESRGGLGGEAGRLFVPGL